MTNSKLTVPYVNCKAKLAKMSMRKASKRPMENH